MLCYVIALETAILEVMKSLSTVSLQYKDYMSNGRENKVAVLSSSVLLTLACNYPLRR